MQTFPDTIHSFLSVGPDKYISLVNLICVFIMRFCMCAPICCRFQIFNIVVQFWVYAIVLDFSCSVCMLPNCVTWIYFKSIPGSEVVHEFCARVCPEMFLCRWVGVT